MQRPILLLLLIAALASAAWLVFADLRSDLDPVQGAPEAGVPGPDADAKPVESAAEPSTGGEVDRVPVEAEGESALREVHVLVVERATGEPVPDAEVFYLEEGAQREFTPEQREEYVSLRSDFELLAHRFGGTARTDEQGRASFLAGRRVRVGARHGELYRDATVGLPPREDPDKVSTLALERDERFVVQVLDSRGRPAVGVPIGLLPRSDESLVPIVLGTSRAPDGLVVVPHQQVGRRNYLQNVWKLAASDGYIVTARIPGLTTGGTVYDPVAPPSGPLVVQLPPTGRVVVRATDRDLVLPEDL